MALIIELMTDTHSSHDVADTRHAAGNGAEVIDGQGKQPRDARGRRVRGHSGELSGGLSGGAQRDSAEVIIFPGIRYERWGDDAASARRDARDGDGGLARDWLEL